ncbi:MAG: rod shape-determining protein RodA [Rhodospirillales bacterium]|nr:rod shape-determining protein RodA [Rhodospirillales bacterium]USO08575.1 MAG: rod shape-determining protein RodA [Rhodospirillales bacterium]
MFLARDNFGRGGFSGRVAAVPLPLVLAVAALAFVGFAALYSAAGGDWDPWARQQAIRFAIGFILMLAVALSDLKWIYRLAYPFWAFCVALLLFVEIKGVIGMGARRWIDLGFVNLQPSDLMKVAIVMALARYYHALPPGRERRLRTLLVPALLTIVPVALIVLQPDLGTSVMIVMVAAAMVYIGGAPGWLFAGGFALFAAAVPTAYHFLHGYQKKRVMTFLDPESDPLGAGYHITQSKIAIGSGGFSGKGYLQGSQAHLNFLPEKHTDFIFTMIAEEWGFVGAIALLALFSFILYQGYRVSLRARTQFGRLLALGLITNYAIYIVINIGMVTGLMPVVGEPLPLISYGGTAMISTLFAFGLILSVAVNRNASLPRG